MLWNKVKPISETDVGLSEQAYNNALSSVESSLGAREPSATSSQDLKDFDSISLKPVDEELLDPAPNKPAMDPSLVRLFKFLHFYGLFVDSEPDFSSDTRTRRVRTYTQYLRLILTLLVAFVTIEVVYDVNLRQSKLMAEQKRSTPLLTFVIMAYSWLSIVIPVICDISLIVIGPYLLRFYSRTTATVCHGKYFGMTTSSDTFLYYLCLGSLAFLDVVGQVVLLGVWPSSLNPYMNTLLSGDVRSVSTMTTSPVRLGQQATTNPLWYTQNANAPTPSNATPASGSLVLADEAGQQTNGARESRITTYFLDFILGENAHTDLGVSIKILCLIIQFAHSYSFLGIIISLSDHFSSAINRMNEQLEKYDFKVVLKQLIIIRDSSEQISLMISLPFSLIMMLLFMRQIALNGVFIQSTMQPYENWAVSLQSFTCSVCILMVFIYCDGLQSASKQTHRLKTEQTVIIENRGGDQSIYESLDYLDRLSKTIRFTFFNIIALNKRSLVGLFGHILSLTFVTS